MVQCLPSRREVLGIDLFVNSDSLLQNQVEDLSFWSEYWLGGGVDNDIKSETYKHNDMTKENTDIFQ